VSVSYGCSVKVTLNIVFALYRRKNGGGICKISLQERTL